MGDSKNLTADGERGISNLTDADEGVGGRVRKPENFANAIDEWPPTITHHQTDEAQE